MCTHCFSTSEGRKLLPNYTPNASEVFKKIFLFFRRLNVSEVVIF